MFIRTRFLLFFKDFNCVIKFFSKTPHYLIFHLFMQLFQFAAVVEDDESGFVFEDDDKLPERSVPRFTLFCSDPFKLCWSSLVTTIDK